MEANILLKRARRLRKLTGNPRLRSKSEIDQEMLSGRQVAYESFVRPFLMATEPAVMFSNIYLGLVCKFTSVLSTTQNLH
jgi:MFS transporter, DHA1 family, multidrug resistance protein